ncbi:MAG TPA: bifunctional hydroxymethylpyrimidine kinase/phosphomethylpyrimidine kinase [Polyangiales bacterium]|nr:bifunctional hydroxymethylpyrimidine kinase/phosphomethylpyrimidine kinase [Polyangiales bacterium]
MLPIALSIAGSDPSAGAGIQADLQTFQSHAVRGTTVVTLLTVQNTRGVKRVELVSPELVAEQLNALLSDLPPAAAKTGALGSAGQVQAIASCFATLRAPLVIDPVVTSTSGAPLLDEAGVRALREQLLPLCALVTPNLQEAARLAGRELRDDASTETIVDAARAIADLGARAVLVKGGHRAGAPVDVLYSEGVTHVLTGARVADMAGAGARAWHGLGCALSAAIAARLARGASLLEACQGAKRWLTRALEHAPDLGSRRASVDHAEPVTGVRRRPER